MVHAMSDLVVEALFVSDLQPSQTPSAGDVQSAIERMILRHGSDGCAAVVAVEFGDHPDTAVRRMTWARQTVNASCPVAVPV
jgi:hypothetical protein